MGQRTGRIGCDYKGSYFLVDVTSAENLSKTIIRAFLVRNPKQIPALIGVHALLSEIDAREFDCLLQGTFGTDSKPGFSYEFHLFSAIRRYSTKTEHEIHSQGTERGQIVANGLDRFHPFPLGLVYVVVHVASPGVNDRVALMVVIIMRHKHSVRRVDIVPMGKETNTTAAFFAIKHVVQVWIYRNVELGVASMETQSGSPHGIGQLGLSQNVAFLCSPISNRRGELDLAQMGYISWIFVVFGNIRHIGTQHGVIVFGQVKHLDQIHVEIVRKVHVRIGLHAKILDVDRLKVQLVRPVSVHKIPVNHGRELAASPGRTLALAGIYRNDPNLVFVLLAIGIILFAITIPAPLIVLQVAPRFCLFNDPKGQPFRVFGAGKRVVERPRTQAVPIRGDQEMDRGILGALGIGILFVVIIGTIVGRRTNRIGHVLVSERSIRK
mmetsp:Transcript_30581/g.72144  ORF Transcript_30581/g.72144 Transcript_30581/m.72144 type:complete len:438 (+) Transcript_30581:452-1765(+)